LVFMRRTPEGTADAIQHPADCQELQKNALLSGAGTEEGNDPNKGVMKTRLWGRRAIAPPFPMLHPTVNALILANRGLLATPSTKRALPRWGRNLRRAGAKA
jgi:hypothetical protein